MQAYHLEIPDKDYALVLFVDGDEQQVQSGDLENISRLVELLTCPVVTLRGGMVSNSYEDGEMRRWIRKSDGKALPYSLLFERATARA